MGPKCSAKVLSILPKEKKTAMYLIGGKKTKKLFNKLHSDMSYGSHGPESNFSKSTVDIKKCL